MQTSLIQHLYNSDLQLRTFAEKVAPTEAIEETFPMKKKFFKLFTTSSIRKEGRQSFVLPTFLQLY